MGVERSSCHASRKSISLTLSAGDQGDAHKVHGWNKSIDSAEMTRIENVSARRSLEETVEMESSGE